MKNLLAEAQAMQEELVRRRRWLHSNPETGECLPVTTAYVKEQLTEMGCEPVEICESGLCVLIGGKKPGKCILLRADMDALPMKEETDLPFASQNGCAHSCGHDMHTSMLLGAARLLKAHEEELCGTVKLMFQPAEETFAGAVKMIGAGILEDPAVDAAVTLHCDCMSEYPVGTLVLARKGLSMASCDRFRIDITGQGSHGAHPEEGVDPINAGAHLLLALQEITTREVSSRIPVVLTVGTFHSGEAANILPTTATMSGTLRCFDGEVRRQVLRRMEEITELTARTFRAEAKLVVEGGCAPLRNNPAVFAALETYFRELVGESGVAVELDSSPEFGAEDFSNVLDRVPGVQFFLSTGSFSDGTAHPMHSPTLVIQEDPLPIGAAAFAYAAARWLEDQSGR